MTGRGAREGREQPRRDTATAAQGTPEPVDVTVDTRERLAVVSLLAGPVVAVVHFAVVYLVAEAGCTGDGRGLDVFDPPVPGLVTAVATAVAALACCGTALWTYRRWRPTDEPEHQLVDRGPLAFVGMLLSLLALMTVVLVGTPALVLRLC